MSRAVRLGSLWVVLMIVAAAPFWATLPEPDAAQRIVAAILVGDRSEQAIALPRARLPAGRWTHFRLEFDTDAEDGQYLFIPILNQRAVVNLNGAPIDDTANRATMIGLASGIPALVPLPPRLLRTHGNVVDLHLETVGLTPGYLSRAYVGSADQLAGHYRLRVFVLEHLKFMVPAAQVLLLLLLLTLWLYRPEDELFGWLALLLGLSMTVHLGMMRDLVPAVDALTPHVTIVGSAAALIMVIVALLIAGRVPPRWLRVLALAVPVVCLALTMSGLVSANRLVLMLNAPLNLAALLATLVIFASAAVRHQVEDAWLMLLPTLMATMAGFHDFSMVLLLHDGPVFLSVYFRPLLLIGFAMILMRRLGASLNTLDNVNAHLKLQLSDQARDLERLHGERQHEAAERVRREERQRLTDDLHDGLSGHLVSIIALSEREGVAAIEQTAREALEDLRLVIHSLDIQDRELPVALAGLRERLERQLKRMGVTLVWSMAPLPEIAGVTPSHALNVLRILQEAITNAVKHGRATRIGVSGGQDGDGFARIQVENDGIPFPCNPERDGAGLNNMRRRINQLNGDIEIEPLHDGARLTLRLPLQLPE